MSLSIFHYDRRIETIIFPKVTNPANSTVIEWTKASTKISGINFGRFTRFTPIELTSTPIGNGCQSQGRETTRTKHGGSEKYKGPTLKEVL